MIDHKVHNRRNPKTKQKYCKQTKKRAQFKFDSNLRNVPTPFLKFPTQRMLVFRFSIIRNEDDEMIFSHRTAQLPDSIHQLNWFD